MRELFVLLRRDFKNNFNTRMWIMLGFLLLFQTWFTITSDSVGQVRKTGEMFYMAVVFAFNFLGSIVALALNHDGISVERETKFLDLILTSGVSKKKVYLSKVLSSVLISGVFSVLYSLAMMILYTALSGEVSMGLMILRYVLPITAFLCIFSLMGLMFSILQRSSRNSLVTSIMLGMFLMPRLLIMIVQAFGNLFGWSDKVVERISMISPALIMNAMNGYSDTPTVLWAVLLLVIYLAAAILTGLTTFIRQDEVNCGE